LNVLVVIVKDKKRAVMSFPIKKTKIYINLQSKKPSSLSPGFLGPQEFLILDGAQEQSS